ncbi:MAG: response regulator transcription factor [Victivallaceae bacterium]|nr:response regulator transcription factor [Victivallaceae bacterium]
MPNHKILIVEDEPPIRELIKMTLEGAGFSEVYEASDGEGALALAKNIRPDLILLDWMLPGMDGLDVCRNLKKSDELGSIPVMMLTAKSEESDIVLGLEMGAVDYVTKPFSRKVLIARVRAQLRAVAETEKSGQLCCNGLVIHPDACAAFLDGAELLLTHGEFEVLRLFAAHPGRVYTRNQIIARIKGDGYPVTERAVDVQILNLRRKLGEWGVNIETIRGVGYRMKAGGAL